MRTLTMLLTLSLFLQPATAVASDAQRLHARDITVNEEGTAVLIRTPGIRQYPELKDGCEVTALAMLLQAVGHPADKMQLAAEVRKDPTPLRYDAQGQVAYWGHPDTGFVGAVDGKPRGFGVYHGPLAELLDKHLPGQAEDLTGQPFERILDKLAQGKPVVAWTTFTLAPTDLWVTWNTPRGPLRTTFNEHAVLLVGKAPGLLYLNNPADGSAAKPIDIEVFKAAWEQLGRQAISIK